MQSNDQSVDQQNQAEPVNKFEAVKARLEEIANAVDDESLSLDEALDLYEEAVKLGLQASDLLEIGVVVEEEQVAEAAQDAPAPEGAADSAPESVSDNVDANQGPAAD